MYTIFTNYLTTLEHAFPEDELLPLTCKGQSHDRKNPHVSILQSFFYYIVLTSFESIEFRNKRRYGRLCFNFS